MPLIHSKTKSAFKKNIGKEIGAGKPLKQALAIAYSVKRKGHEASESPVKEAMEKKLHEVENKH